MSNLKKIIMEEISAISRDKKDVIFDYKAIQEDAWNDLKRDAQKFQRINFDFENDDTDSQKTFYLKKNLRKDQPVKYEVQAALHMAGGDWEYPVMYFRIEFIHDYGVFSSEHEKKPEYMFDEKDFSGRKFCLIPPVEVGNKLVKGKSDSGKYDWFAYQDSEMTPEEEKAARITDADKKNVWNWLKEWLEEIINERHEVLD